MKKKIKTKDVEKIGYIARTYASYARKPETVFGLYDPWMALKYRYLSTEEIEVIRAVADFE